MLGLIYRISAYLSLSWCLKIWHFSQVPGWCWLCYLGDFTLWTICLHTSFLLPCLPLILQLLQQILIFIILPKVFSLTSFWSSCRRIKCTLCSFLSYLLYRNHSYFLLLQRKLSSVWFGEVRLPPSFVSFWHALSQPLFFSNQTLNVRIHSGSSSYLYLRFLNDPLSPICMLVIPIYVCSSDCSLLQLDKLIFYIPTWIA